ncbi:MAG: hypothetical protein AAGI03_08195 [Pseudomonadota bacterium]
MNGILEKIVGKHDQPERADLEQDVEVHGPGGSVSVRAVRLNQDDFDCEVNPVRLGEGAFSRPSPRSE